MIRIFNSHIVRCLLIGILAVGIGVNIFGMSAAYLTGNAVPMPFGYGASVVLSGSMEPTLSVGDLLIVREQEIYECGDIVIYQNGTLPVVHRIVSINGEMITTRGDANNVDDESLHLGVIKGEVVAAVPFIGYLVWALKSPVAVVVMLAIAIILIEWSFQIGKTEKEAEKEKMKAEIRALIEELKEN